MSFGEFLAAQEDNLRQVSKLPEFTGLFSLVNLLYERGFTIFAATGGQLYFARLMLVCHRALFSAGATICRAQPDDAAGVTRRAIEAARIALAIKHDRKNLDRWARSEERVDRWTARIEGRKPKALRDEVQHPKGHPAGEWLARQLGVLSDAEVHFTPEFLLNRTWDTKDGEAGKKWLKLQYFEGNQRELEGALVLLAGTHGIILNVFDECFDGALSKDQEWGEVRERFARLGQTLSARRRADSKTDHGPLFEKPTTE
jgi:hypothetical protein